MPGVINSIPPAFSVLQNGYYFIDFSINFISCFRYYKIAKMGKARNHGGTGGHGVSPMIGERPNYNRHVMGDKVLLGLVSNNERSKLSHQKGSLKLSMTGVAESLPNAYKAKRLNEDRLQQAPPLRSPSQQYTSVVQPVASANQPVASVKQPVAPVKQPVASVKLPGASIKQTVASVKQPVASVKQHVALVKHPGASFKLPVASVKQPVASVKQQVTPGLNALQKQQMLISDKPLIAGL